MRENRADSIRSRTNWHRLQSNFWISRSKAILDANRRIQGRHKVTCRQEQTWITTRTVLESSCVALMVTPPVLVLKTCSARHAYRGTWIDVPIMSNAMTVSGAQNSKAPDAFFNLYAGKAYHRTPPKGPDRIQMNSNNESISQKLLSVLWSVSPIAASYQRINDWTWTRNREVLVCDMH